MANENHVFTYVKSRFTESICDRKYLPTYVSIFDAIGRILAIKNIDINKFFEESDFFDEKTCLKKDECIEEWLLRNSDKLFEYTTLVLKATPCEGEIKKVLDALIEEAIQIQKRKIALDTKLKEIIPDIWKAAEKENP
jgi:hypothetical protein